MFFVVMVLFMWNFPLGQLFLFLLRPLDPERNRCHIDLSGAGNGAPPASDAPEAPELLWPVYELVVEPAPRAIGFCPRGQASAGRARESLEHAGVPQTKPFSRFG